MSIWDNNKKIKPQHNKLTEGERLKFDADSCIECGMCDAECPTNAIQLGHINNSECIKCGACEAVCPVEAITRIKLF